MQKLDDKRVRFKIAGADTEIIVNLDQVRFFSAVDGNRMVIRFDAEHSIGVEGNLDAFQSLILGQHRPSR